MDESRWIWPLTSVGELAEVLALVVVLGAFALRVLPSSRRWAPRGRGGVARPVRADRTPAWLDLRFPSHPSH